MQANCNFWTIFFHFTYCLYCFFFTSYSWDFGCNYDYI